MKRAAYRHPKMLALASRLGIPRAHAIGLIEVLLDYTADAAPQGNIGKWADGAIAEACEWKGDPSAFVQVLVETGWLDRCARHRLVVHDLAHHAQSWWIAMLKKNGQQFASAVTSVRTRRKVAPKITVTTTSESHLKCLSDASQVGSDPTSEASTLLSSPLLSSPLPREREAEAPKVVFVKDVHSEAKAVSEAYHGKVTRAHTSTGIPEIRSLLLDDAAKDDLLAAVTNASAWFDREGTEPKFRPSAPKFFADGGWHRFVKGVPDSASKGPGGQYVRGSGQSVGQSRVAMPDGKLADYEAKTIRADASAPAQGAGQGSAAGP